MGGTEQEMLIPDARYLPVSEETAEVGSSRVNLLPPLSAAPLHPAASSEAVLSVTLLQCKEGFRCNAV